MFGHKEPVWKPCALRCSICLVFTHFFSNNMLLFAMSYLGLSQSIALHEHSAPHSVTLAATSRGTGYVPANRSQLRHTEKEGRRLTYCNTRSGCFLIICLFMHFLLYFPSHFFRLAFFLFSFFGFSFYTSIITLYPTFFFLFLSLLLFFLCFFILLPLSPLFFFLFSYFISTLLFISLPIHLTSVRYCVYDNITQLLAKYSGWV
jgi:hypothetical protein